MSKSKFLTLAVVALFLLNAATLAFFFFKKPPPPSMQDGPKKVIIERLHFDAQQVAEYEKLIAQHQQEVAAQEQEIGAAKKALYGQLRTDGFAKRDSLILVIGKLQGGMEIIHFQHFASLKKLCNAEQMDDFNALTADLADYFSPQPKPGKRGK